MHSNLLSLNIGTCSCICEVSQNSQSAAGEVYSLLHAGHVTSADDRRDTAQHGWDDLMSAELRNYVNE